MRKFEPNLTDVRDVTRPRRPTEGFFRDDTDITTAIATRSETTA